MKQLLFVCLWLFVLAAARAQLPSLDPAFNGNGVKKFHFAYRGNFNDDHIKTVLVKNDGKYLVVLESYNTVLAQYNSNGTLDKTFGENGFSESVYLNSSVGALQNDGKVVVAGVLYEYSGQANFSVVRFNADGTLDYTFGNHGRTSIDFFSYNDFAYAVTIQNDGKILVAGEAYNPGIDITYFALARFNADGTMDNSFSEDGKLTTAFGSSYQTAFSVIVQTDGRILAAGRAYNPFTSYDMAVARYLADGTPDSSFNSTGKVVTDFDSHQEMAYSIAVETNSIIAAGVSWDGSTAQKFALVRYNTDGTIDADFGIAGAAYADFGYDSQLNSIALQTDGHIVAAGRVYLYNSGNDTWQNDLALARFNTDGSPETSFGTNGILHTEIGVGDDEFYSVAVLTDGTVVAGGYCFNTERGNNDFVLARYDNTGVPDPAFNSTGFVVGYYAEPVESLNAAIALQADGKKLVVGEADMYNENNDYVYLFALARFKIDGTPDSSFGTNGSVLADFGMYAGATEIAIQPDQKILVAGYVENSGTWINDFALVRFKTDGTLDSAFGINGKVTTGFGSDYARAYSIALMNDGKILLGGGAMNSETYVHNFALACYNIDGTLYGSFGTGGKLLTDMTGNEANIYSLVVQPDGKVLAAGEAYVDTADFDFALARYDILGNLDNTFGIGGKVFTDFGDNGFDGIASVALQPDGKIVTSGWAEHYIEGTGNGDMDFALARYNVNGSLDATFGTAGKVLTNFGASDYAYPLTLQTDGKIIAAGTSETYDESTYTDLYDLAIARYNANGTLDNTFGTGGKMTSDLFGDHDQRLYSSVWNNGKLYISGYFFPYSAPAAGYIAAYNTGGTVPSGPPLVKISDATVNEHAGNASLNVTLNKSTSAVITINFTTFDSTAVSRGRNPDFKSTKGTIAIPAGSTSASITIPVRTDVQTEADEYFKVVLSLNRKMINSAGFEDSVGVVTIVNGEALAYEEPAIAVKTMSQDQLSKDKLVAKATPNPTLTYFALQLQSANTLPVTVLVTDILGRTVETKSGIGSNSTIRLGNNYRPGVYFVQFIQGNDKFMLKLVKQ